MQRPRPAGPRPTAPPPVGPSPVGPFPVGPSPAGPRPLRVRERAADAARAVAVRWPYLLVLAAVAVSVGPPLVGIGVFHATDILAILPPWRAEAPAGLLPQNGILADTVNGAMPPREEFLRRLRDGDFALWAQEPGPGMPLGAVPDLSLLSPLMAPYYLLPSWYAPAVTKALELTVAAAGTILFLRRAGLSRVPASLGGLVYMNSGFQVAWTNWPQTMVGAFIPLLFWSVERAVQLRRPAALVPVALSVACLVFGGFPAVTGFALLAAGGYAVVRCAASPGRLAARAGWLLALGAGVLLGMALAALQLLPFAQRLAYLSLDYRVALSGRHLPPEALLTAVIPWSSGAYGDGVALSDWNIVESLSFISVTAAVLLVVAALGGHRLGLPRGLSPTLWSVLVVVGILVYAGGPLLALAELAVPPLFESNFIGRARAVLGFAAAALAGIGLQVLLSGALRKGPPRRGAVAIRAVVAAAVVGVAAVASGSAALENAAAAGQLDYLLRRSVLPAVAVTVAVVAVVVALLGNRRARGIVAVLLPLVVVVESLTVTYVYWPRIDRDMFYPVTPVHSYLAEELGADRVLPQGRAMEPGATTFYDLRVVAAHQFFPGTWRELLLRMDPAAFAVHTFPTFATEAETAAEVAASPLADRIAARFFVGEPLMPVVGDAEPLSAPPQVVAVDAGGRVELSAPEGELRAVRVWLAAAALPRGDGPATLRASIIAPDGTVVTTGTRRIDDAPRSVRPGPVDVAFPQAPAGDGATLVLEVDGAAAPALLGASDDGTVVARPVRARADGLRTTFVSGVVVYERTAALPRVRWASDAVVVRGPDERLDILAGGDLADETVVLSAPGPEPAGLPAELRVREDGGDEVVVDVTAEGSGYLVVADGLQQGWTARVDGERVALRSADHALVAVAVPEGDSSVELRYEPTAWDTGLLLSGAGVVGCLLLGLFGRGGGALSAERRPRNPRRGGHRWPRPPARP